MPLLTIQIPSTHNASTLSKVSPSFDNHFSSSCFDNSLQETGDPLRYVTSFINVHDSHPEHLCIL